ncbi:PIN domain nuclease [Mycobacterium helveticum]|uniref:Ribonuclease VapC n=1 Tax=Mycobacterium helveticum TaxID=2592811 RepID=A0A557Y114_9MYCO|nr:PIN domain nuclease [Mycobacterium helveticum]TVS88350.1 PIN domain nuclease [Mycobacterium helveticum]TVS92272.1 PIN domain nuclease [Mycobacterium helveticum]
MGLKAHFLGDTSAVARVTKPAVAQRLIPLIEAGLVARCTITDLEAGISARNGRDWKRTRHARSPWPRATIDQDVLDRALEVQGALAVAGLHRTVKLGDLLVAAAAERARLVVLHYDHDFDRIATITGQPTEWVAPPGAVD